MNSIDYINFAKSGDIDIHKTAKKTIEEASSIDNDYHYFMNIADTPNFDGHKKKGRLYGLPVSVKDCICVKDMESKAGSKMLEGYSPIFDATVIERIKDEGAFVLGKTSQDVFGFGSFNVNVGLGYKVPLNPIDKKRTTGGSSGGAAGITRKIESPHIAISESTGGSIAAPASYCGIYGMTPTYGRVSRYGLMDYSNSMDKIGVMAKDIDDLALMLEVISGKDEKDSTCSDKPVPKFTEPSKSKLNIAVIKESIGEGVQEGVKKNLFSRLDKYDAVSMPLTFRYGVQAYYLISMSEASTNLAKLCGMRYGVQGEIKDDFNSYFSKIRSENFSKEEKRRIMLGTFARMSGYRDAFYIKALKVRTLIINEYKRLFEKYDIIISPTMPNIAPKFSEIDKMTPLENYMMDIMTVGPNIAGLPHINIPSGESEGMPTGLMAISDHFEEKKLIDFARNIR
jgi:aspartyl-tRNA(Asn)/glutamyl-tRNA(Gln) amidotransferase subunit A